MSLGAATLGCGLPHPACEIGGHCVECQPFGEHRCACGRTFHAIIA
jgi:hypothetical protein